MRMDEGKSQAPLHEQQKRNGAARKAGWGIDTPEKRPGVPLRPKEVPAAGAHTPTRRQAKKQPVTKRMEIDEVTPVFSNVAPPKGLSGVIRRFAYTFPEHLARKWLLLLVADKVDVLEHRLRARWPLVAGLAGWFAFRQWRSHA